MTELDGDRLYRGDGKTVDIAIANNGAGSLVGAGIRFVLARITPKGQQIHLITLTRAAGEISVSQESASALTASFTIPSSATANLFDLPALGARLQWDIEVTPSTGEPITQQGQMLLLPDTRSTTGLSGVGAIASNLEGEL